MTLSICVRTYIPPWVLCRCVDEPLIPTPQVPVAKYCTTRNFDQHYHVFTKIDRDLGNRYSFSDNIPASIGENWYSYTFRNTLRLAPQEELSLIKHTIHITNNTQNTLQLYSLDRTVLSRSSITTSAVLRCMLKRINFNHVAGLTWSNTLSISPTTIYITHDY
jgi:hypothetical protein